MKLTKMAQQVRDWVSDGNDINQDNIPKEILEFINNISCGDGFWYGITYGGGIDLKLIVECNNIDQLTFSELKEIEELWKQISVEF